MTGAIAFLFGILFTLALFASIMFYVCVWLYSERDKGWAQVALVSIPIAIVGILLQILT